QEAIAGVHADEHPARAEAAQDAAAETAGAATELDHAVAWPKREIIQQPFGRVAEMSVLNFQSARRPGGLAEHVVMRFRHAVILSSWRAEPRKGPVKDH